MMKFLITIFIALPTLIMAAPTAQAADPIYTAWRNNDAVAGYDVVSFYSGKPLKGQDRYKTEFEGALWRFSSQANLDLFNTNPEAFIPQFGGYCAWAAAKGKLAKGSPKYWHVRDGRLYLKFNGRIKDIWERDIPQYISRASQNWPDLMTK